MRRLSVLALAFLCLAGSCQSSAPTSGVAPHQETTPTAARPSLWEAVVTDLASEFPPPGGQPVAVSLTPLFGLYYGMTFEQDGVIEVLVEAGMPLSWQLETLAHEWAHVSLWGVHLEDPHDELFGVAYSRTYREMLRSATEYQVEPLPPSPAPLAVPRCGVTGGPR